MSDDLREKVARAIYEDRYSPDSNPTWVSWENLKHLAEETEDGGNGIYLTMLRHADAAMSAMPTWRPVPAEVREGVEPWDGRRWQVGWRNRFGGDVIFIAQFHGWRWVSSGGEIATPTHYAPIQPLPTRAGHPGKEE